jgi:hypothetical protein
VYRHATDRHLLLDQHRTGHRLTQPYRPQTNSNVQRCNHTLLDESAYTSVFTTNDDRRQTLTT